MFTHCNKHILLIRTDFQHRLSPLFEINKEPDELLLLVVLFMIQLKKRCVHIFLPVEIHQSSFTHAALVISRVSGNYSENNLKLPLSPEESLFVVEWKLPLRLHLIPSCTVCERM